MSVSSRRLWAIVRKELREFRRNRPLIVGMAVVPVLFCVQPLVAVFTLDPAASHSLGQEHVLLYMLGIPALVPTFVAAYSVVGERQQGTLEPVLTTPIRREELLLGKALAALLPSLAVAYVVYGLFLACVALLAALASLPSIVVTTLVGLNIIRVSLIAGLLAAAALLLLNWIGWRVASAMFDRERLIVATRG
jgi:ABC-type Na+ efflux pump permease subunit